MSNDVLIVQGSEWDSIKEQAAVARRSGLLPQSIKTDEQAAIIALKGRELGLPVMQSLSSIAVISGKPTLSAELMLALAYKHVPGASVIFVESTDKICRILASRGESEPSPFSFSMEDAKKAGLVRPNTPWTKFPQNMLRARCISNVCRAMFPDAIAGCYTHEEMEAVAESKGPMRDVTPVRLDLPGLGSAKQESLAEPMEEPTSYVIDFGQFSGQAVDEVPRKELRSYCDFIRKSAKEQGKPITDKVLVFLTEADKYLDTLSGPPGGATDILANVFNDHESKDTVKD